MKRNMASGRVGGFSSVGHHGQCRLGGLKGLFLCCNFLCSLKSRINFSAQRVARIWKSQLQGVKWTVEMPFRGISSIYWWFYNSFRIYFKKTKNNKVTGDNLKGVRLCVWGCLWVCVLLFIAVTDNLAPKWGELYNSEILHSEWNHRLTMCCVKPDISTTRRHFSWNNVKWLQFSRLISLPLIFSQFISS